MGASDSTQGVDGWGRRCARDLPRAALEFTVLGMPSLLAMTVWSDYVVEVLVVLVAAGVSARVLRQKRKRWRRRLPTAERGAGNAPARARPRHITQFRSGIMLFTCMAILAVDFPAFPRRYVKTETYGTSLMDLGVGAFVVSGGMVSSLARSPRKRKTEQGAEPERGNGGGSGVGDTLAASVVRTVRPVVPVLFLGLLRIAMVWGVEYQEHVSEYGVHWNFFFTLGVLHLLAAGAVSYTHLTLPTICSV